METIIEAIKSLCTTDTVESLSFHYSTIELGIGSVTEQGRIKDAASFGSMLDKIYDHNLVHIAQTSYEVYWATNASDKGFLAEIVLCLSSVKESSDRLPLPSPCSPELAKM